MSDRLPPLTALRAFEAAARHMSFARAAEELSVTPAALSFQIKSLEDQLGQPVFRRLNRAVELTELGRLLLPSTSDGFTALNNAWRSARRYTETTTLTVTSGPSFTAKWLSPRLFDFAQKHPEIELRFAATMRVMDFDRDEVDVAIRFGNGRYPGLFSRPLIREWFTPMMSPELAATYRSPADLAHATLFHAEDTEMLSPSVDWRAWFEAEGVPVTPKAGPRFSRSDHAVDAAISGSGVVLGRISLTSQALRHGQLIAPFQTALSTDAHYTLVCQAGAETLPQIAAFHDWISGETTQVDYFASGRNFVAPRQETVGNVNGGVS